MSFADAMRKDGSFTRTENGAVALNTTGDARLDLFGTIGSLRETDEGRIETLFAEAYNQDALFATKIAFYARDIRGGLGERKTFRTIIRYMAEKHPEALRPQAVRFAVSTTNMMYCTQLPRLPFRHLSIFSFNTEIRISCVGGNRTPISSLPSKKELLLSVSHGA